MGIQLLPCAWAFFVIPTEFWSLTITERPGRRQRSLNNFIVAEVHSQQFCKTCGKLTLHTRPGTNNLVHALVTLFLCGLWLPVWIVVGIVNASHRPHCTQCGGK